MKIANDIATLHQSLAGIRQQQDIVLIPTMGNLHKGHLQLIEKAKSLSETIVVSIFVNPLQFSLSEDLLSYPRTLDSDIAKLQALDVPFVFVPNQEEFYSNLKDHTKVNVPKISEDLCGIFRPQLFAGVSTVIAKLFNIVQPQIAIFGEKDYQQLHIIKKMVRDLSFPIRIESIPTVREADGLAMSSRNQYLTSNERAIANHIYVTLQLMRDRWSQGVAATDIYHDANLFLDRYQFKVDYLAIRNKNTLAPAKPYETEIIFMVAAWLGKARLIDNLIV